MDLAVMEQVIKEILQQQKEMSAEMEKESEARQQIFIKMEAYEKKLDGIKIPASDPSAILLPVKRWIEEIRSEMEKQPKTVVQEKRFQLLPNWSVELYKGIFKGIIVLIVVIYGLVVLNRYMREREYLHYKQAWQYLYSQQKEDYKMRLDSVWNDSQKGK